jgi:hypothetical protein
MPDMLARLSCVVAFTLLASSCVSSSEEDAHDDDVLFEAPEEFEYEPGPERACDSVYWCPATNATEV